MSDLDDFVPRPHKKARLHKFSAHNFVDDEAGEDDEFDVNEEELEVSDRELLTMQAQADARADDKDRRRREFEKGIAQFKANKGAVEEPYNPLADRIHEKYVNIATHNEEICVSGDSPIHNEGAPISADEMQDEEAELLPAIQDPKLWMVYCTPGKERQCIIDLMNLWHRTAGKPLNKLFIKSAFTTDIVQSGYFYVEAFREIHVRRAIQQIQNVRKRKGAKLVPMNEMVHSMTTHDPDTPMKRGQWVRIKRGLYKNDLAQVLSIKDQGAKAKVKMLPRLDYTKTQFGRQGGSRPVQRLFNASEVRKMLAIMNDDGSLENKRGMFYFKGNCFKNGYLIKQMNAASVTSNAQPTAEEVKKFKLRYDDVEDQIPAPQITQRKNKFETRDRVVVVEGDLTNLRGLVQSMNGDTVTFIPENKQLSDLEFQASELRKFFEQGDHIKVVSGKNTGETGMVLTVQAGGSEIVFWSGQANTTVKAQDCTLSTEINSGQDTIGELELHDLVKLSRDSAGCIVQIKKGRIKLLNENGVAMIVGLKDIIQKLNTRNTHAYDVNRRDIRNGDMVQVRQGEHAGNSGTIKCVYRSVLFLHSRQHNENNGIFAVKSSFCELIGAGVHRADSKNRIITTARNTRITKAQRRDPMTGLTVKIRTGGHTGQIGIVKRVVQRGHQTILEVELHSPSVTISVPKNAVILCDANGVPHRDNDTRGRNAHTAASSQQRQGQRQGQGMASLYGAMTPTPLHRGDQTPYRSQTPVHPGLRTPGNIWTVGEPTLGRKTTFEDDEDDNVDMIPKTPSFLPATPNYQNSPPSPAMARDSSTPDSSNPSTTGMSSNPNSPDDYDYPKTPATPMTPNPTPFTPGSPSPTSGTSDHTSGTPGPTPTSPYDKEDTSNDPKTPRTPVL